MVNLVYDKDKAGKLVTHPLGLNHAKVSGTYKGLAIISKNTASQANARLYLPIFNAEVQVRTNSLLKALSKGLIVYQGAFLAELTLGSVFGKPGISKVTPTDALNRSTFASITNGLNIEDILKTAPKPEYLVQLKASVNLHPHLFEGLTFEWIIGGDDD